MAWADVSVLGVSDDMMEHSGVRADAPMSLERDGQGVWRDEQGRIAVSAPADVALGSTHDSALGPLIVADHTRAGTWVILTDWRHRNPVDEGSGAWTDAIDGIG